MPKGGGNIKLIGGVNLGNADAIADFANGTDLIGLAGGLSFGELNIIEAGNDIEAVSTADFCLYRSDFNRRSFELN